MRILLVSDTHGQFELMNRLVVEKGCDAVIHAGDFGFYDEQSIYRLSDREINLRIVHSGLEKHEKDSALRLPIYEKQRLIGSKLPLSELPAFLNSERCFPAPVYAVWGNHEDVEVVKSFLDGSYAAPNLHILHEGNQFEVGGCHVFGLGGNLLTSKKLFQKPIAGGGGKIWSTIWQYLKLIDQVQKSVKDDGPRIMVSHVSPGKEPLVSIVGAILGASFIISGHMGAPCTMVWNEFAIREPDEAIGHLNTYVASLVSLAEKHGNQAKDSVALLADLFQRSMQNEVYMGSRERVPQWYRGMRYVNLPDCDVGFSVLKIEGSGFQVESFSV